MLPSSNGQLYIAISKVSGLKILAIDEYGNTVNETINVVFRKVSRNV